MNSVCRTILRFRPSLIELFYLEQQEFLKVERVAPPSLGARSENGAVSLL